MYPKRLGEFRKWAKAMEVGAVMDRPEYRGKRRLKASGKKTRRRRRTRPRRARKAE